MKEKEKTGKGSAKGDSIGPKPRKETVISLNKKAYHDFEILNKYDAGIVLQGTEVKSLRSGKANLGDAYGRIKGGELWLWNVDIPIYRLGTFTNHEPGRMRKLLMKKSEIRKIEGKLKDKSLTLVPLKLYFDGPYVKVELGLAKGKKLYDKREAIKKADVQRKLKRVTI